MLAIPESGDSKVGGARLAKSPSQEDHEFEASLLYTTISNKEGWGRRREEEEKTKNNSHVHIDLLYYQKQTLPPAIKVPIQSAYYTIPFRLPAMISRECAVNPVRLAKTQMLNRTSRKKKTFNTYVLKVLSFPGTKACNHGARRLPGYVDYTKQLLPFICKKKVTLPAPIVKFNFQIFRAYGIIFLLTQNFSIIHPNCPYVWRRINFSLQGG